MSRSYHANDAPEASGGKRPRTQRRNDGVYYTPEPVVQAMVRWTLGDLLTARSSQVGPKVLEPACGQGAFLVEVYRYLAEQAARSLGVPILTFEDRRELVLLSIFAVDIDPAAIAIARRRLAETVAGPDTDLADELERDLVANLRCGDALIDAQSLESETGCAEAFDWPAEFPTVMDGPATGFDAVIGNPPYVNARLLLQSRGQGVKNYLRRRYRSARGGYDLYVLFIEKAFELLRDGGRCGFIVPNKIAGLDYAREIRGLLAGQCRIDRVVDLSGCRVFPDANVYPYVLVWQKQPPAPEHTITVSHAGSVDELDGRLPAWQVLQSRLSAETGWHFHGALDVEARVPTVPLSDLVVLSSGTTGFAAARIAAELEDDPAGGGFDFIVSGNIDRYRIRLGGVRYMNRDYRRPLLPRDSMALSKAKRRLFEGPKIVVAGMTRRLEAAWDNGGLALGVQVYAAAELKIDPMYLLAILNSRLLSHLYRMRFQAKRLAGGYLSINKRQLGSLPIVLYGPDDAEGQAAMRRLATLGSRLQDGFRTSSEGSAEELERAVDEQVYALYGLSAEEIRAVEAKF